MRGLNESNYKYQTSSGCGESLGQREPIKLRGTLRPLWSAVNSEFETLEVATVYLNFWPKRDHYTHGVRTTVERSRNEGSVTT